MPPALQSLVEFAGKRIVLVGGSSGIGRALARQLARVGAYVIVAARSADALDNLVHGIRLEGGNADARVLDTTDRSAVREAVAALQAEGPVDGLVYVAGRSHVTMWDRYRVAETRSLFEANFFGFLYWLEEMLPAFRERGDGFIAATTALCAYRGIPSGAEYAATKGALGNFLEGLRLDLAPHGIRVIQLMPGFVDTPMTRKNNLSQPFTITADQAARLVVEEMKKGKTRIEFGRGMARVMRLLRNLPDRLYYGVFRRSFIEPRSNLEQTIRALPPFICPEHRNPLEFDRYASFQCSDCEHRVSMVFNYMDLADGTGTSESDQDKKIKLAYRFYSLVYPIAALFACWFVWKGSVRQQIAYYRSRLADAAQAGAPLVDVATGDGSLLKLAIKPLKNVPPLLSIDLSQSMLKKASKRLRSIPRKLFLISDIGKVSLPTASFSHMVCFGGLHVFGDLREALGNMRRILKPGGTLAGSYLLKPGTPRRDRFTAWCVKIGLLSNTHTPEELDQIFQEAGFECVDRQLNGRMMLFTLRKPASCADAGASTDRVYAA